MNNLKRIWTSIWVAGGLGALIWHCGRHGLWHDEVLAVAGTLQKWPDILFRSAPGEGLFQLVASLWIRVAPFSPFWVELPAAIAVWLACWIALRRALHATSGVASWLLTPALMTSAFLLIQGVEFRPYPFITLAVVFLFSRIDRPIKRADSVAAGLMGICNPLAIPYAGLVSISRVLRSGREQVRPVLTRVLLPTLTTSGTAILVFLIGLEALGGDAWFRSQSVQPLNLMMIDAAGFLTGVELGWIAITAILVLSTLQKPVPWLLFLWGPISFTLIWLLHWAGASYMAMRYLLPAALPLLVLMVHETGRLPVRIRQAMQVAFLAVLCAGNIIGHLWYLAHPVHAVTPRRLLIDGNVPFPGVVVVDPLDTAGAAYLPAQLAYQVAATSGRQPDADCGNRVQIVLTATQSRYGQYLPSSFSRKWLCELEALPDDRAAAVYIPLGIPGLTARAAALQLHPWWRADVRALLASSVGAHMDRKLNVYDVTLTTLEVPGGIWISIPEDRTRPVSDYLAALWNAAPKPDLATVGN